LKALIKIISLVFTFIQERKKGSEKAMERKGEVTYIIVDNEGGDEANGVGKCHCNCYCGSTVEPL
jgi:hypothetical protein